MKKYITSGTRSFQIVLLSSVLLLSFSLFPVKSIAQDNKENSEFKLAINLYNDGMYDLALQQIKNFIDAYPSTSQGIEARFYLGLTQFKLKRYEDARFTFQNFALSYVDHPKAPEAWMKVGEAYSALRNDVEAAAAYERVKTFFPKSPLVPDALLSAARLYRRSGEIELSKKMLRTILEDYPKSANVYSARLTLADLYIDQGQTDLAEQEARHIAESEAPLETKSSAMFMLGKIQYDACLFDMAENTLQNNIKKYPGTSGAINSSLVLGMLLSNELKFTEAIQQFQTVISSKETDSIRITALVQAGDASIGAKNYPAAIKYFDQVLSDYKTSPQAGTAMYEAGRAAMLGGNYNDAIEYFKRTLLLPENHLQRKSLIRMAESAALLKQFQQSAGYYTDFLTQYPGDPSASHILSTLGALYRVNLQDYRKAISVYGELIQKYPRSPEAADAMFNMGTCQEHLGSYGEAVGTFQGLLHEYPTYAGSEEIRHRVEFLQDHKVQNLDESLLKLSRLVGEMLLQKPAPQLSLELADIYFHDLKDYRLAAEQYSNAVEKSLSEQEFIDAYYNRARAFDLLSETDSTASEQAILYYESFIKQYPANPLSYSATFYSIRIKSKRSFTPELAGRAGTLLTTTLPPELKEQLLYMLSVSAANSSSFAEEEPFINRLKNDYPSSWLTQKALMNAGDWYAAHGHADTALTFWRNAVDKNPSGNYSAALLERIGAMQLQLKDYSGAADSYQKLTAQFPYSSEAARAKYMLPGILQSGGKYAESIKPLEDLKKNQQDYSGTAKDTLAIELKLAIANDKLHKTDLAVAGYRSFLHENIMDDHASQAFYSLGVIAKADGKTDAATSYFRQAALHGGVTGATPEIAGLLFENEQYGDAAKQYTQLAQNTTDPLPKKLYLHKGIIATLRDDKLAEAQKLINVYRTNYPAEKDSEAEFLYETGLYYYRQQNYKTANETFDKLAGDYKETKFGPWGEYYMAKILEVTNVLDDAAKRYDDILQKHPTSDVIPHVLLSLGNMHFNAERYDDAIKYYQAITDKPDLSEEVLPYAMNNLIQAYESKKLYDAALKITKDYIARYPTDENIVDKKIKVGLLYTKLGYYDQAIVHFQNLINESGSLLEAELRYNIGEAYYNKGDYEQAILEFLKVPYLVSRQGKVNWTATSLYMAGQSYEKMSKFTQALEMYQQVIDRTGIDATFKAAAKKEIDRVKTIIKQ